MVASRKVKIQVIGAQAKPGAELASIGINMGQFCTNFNEKTQDRKGDLVPVVISIYKDKSFNLELKTTPTANLILKALNLKKGSDNSRKNFVGEISIDKIRKIAEYKIVDFNTDKIEGAINIVIGTAKSMGIKIIGEIPIIPGRFSNKHIKKKKINKQFRIFKIKKIKAIPSEDGKEVGSKENNDSKKNEKNKEKQK